GGVGMGAEALDIAYLGGDALLAGTFTTIQGIGRTRLARVSIDAPATVDATWDPTTNGFEMTTLEVGHDDGVYVGGFVNQIDSQPRNRLAKLIGPDGSPDPAWVADTYWTALNAIAIQANGDVLIGGTWRGDLSSDYVSLVPRFGIAALPPAIPVVVLPDPLHSNGFE
ncbi:MAG TPA: hypothetical protein VFO79_16960, partial [Xanthomonadales bacterium]|nr:hypothetical protein [Xanthomonadales bacterium]